MVRKIVLFVMAVLVATFALVPAALADSATIVQKTNRITLNADGSSELSSHMREKYVGGPWTSRDYSLRADAPSDVKFLSVTGPGNAVSTLTVDPQADDNEPAGTYRVQWNNPYVEVRQFYSVFDTTTDFGFLAWQKRDPLLSNYSDATQFYGSLTSAPSGSSVYDVTGVVVPPVPLERTEVTAWVDSPPGATLAVQPDGTVIAHAAVLRSGERLVVRILYPAGSVSGVPTHPTAIRDTAAQAESAKAFLRVFAGSPITRAERRIVATSVFALGCLLAGLLLFLRYGRAEGRAQRMRDPIPSANPAVAGVMALAGQVMPSHVAAQVVDLADRGFVTAAAVLGDGGAADVALTWRGEAAPSDLSDQALTDLLFRGIAPGGTVRLAEIPAWASANPVAFQGWLAQYSRTLQQRAVAETAAFSARRRRASIWIFVLAATALLLGGAVGAIERAPIALLAPVLAGVALVVMGVQTLRRSRTALSGSELYAPLASALAAWAATGAGAAPKRGAWRRLLVLATAFGSAAPAAERLAEREPTTAAAPELQVVLWWARAPLAGRPPASRVADAFDAAARAAAAATPPAPPAA